jgi:hypothetical protein
MSEADAGAERLALAFCLAWGGRSRDRVSCRSTTCTASARIGVQCDKPGLKTFACSSRADWSVSLLSWSPLVAAFHSDARRRCTKRAFWLSCCIFGAFGNACDEGRWPSVAVAIWTQIWSAQHDPPQHNVRLLMSIASRAPSEKPIFMLPASLSLISPNRATMLT